MSAFTKTIFSVLIFVLVFAGCTAETPIAAVEDEHPAAQSSMEKESEKTVKYQRITPEEAQDNMTAEAVILDVRTPEEFGEGHIPNAVLLPDYDITAKAADLLPDKDQAIFVYCRSGRRSQAASMSLIELGYTQVYDFGGIIDWTGEITR